MRGGELAVEERRGFRAGVEALTALVDHLGQRVQAGVVVIAQAALLVVEEVLQRRHALGDGEKLVDLLLVLRHRVRHLGMREHVGHLVGDQSA